MAQPHDRKPSVSAAEALRRLQDGNRRFLDGRARFPTIQKEILADLAKGQQPYATILCCSDSRVPPELIFDAGFGELFIVRVAGNVLSQEIAGSLQYAGTHLNTELFVVMGHDGCGAVQAALDTLLHDTRHRSRIQTLVDGIIPGLTGLDGRLPPRELLLRAVEANVRHTMRQILESPEGRARQAEGRIRLAGAVYAIETGQVCFLPDLPEA
ncbi:MAG TPA: carbonic anhydrase [Acidobacteriota bacterium]|nr:carbonic anhydrase [Acidobacteriota bacterium]HQM63522.1 carbonic anhydrase [Acidobacteriota bacterium]